MLYNKTIVDYRGSGYDVISPRSILVFSGRYHIISTASIVNNCIVYLQRNHKINHSKNAQI